MKRRHFYFNRANRLRLYAQTIVDLYKEIKSFQAYANTQPQIWPRVHLKQLDKIYDRLRQVLALGRNTDDIPEFTPTEKKKLDIKKI